VSFRTRFKGFAGSDLATAQECLVAKAAFVALVPGVGDDRSSQARGSAGAEYRGQDFDLKMNNQE